MKIKQDVLAVLDRCTFDGSAMKISEQLDRKLYVDVAKVIECAGGKWNRKAQAHLFDGDAAAAIEPVILTGEITNAKQEFGEFFTPPEIAERVIERALIRTGMRVLEPSAGRGALAVAVSRKQAIVDCIEVSQKNCDYLADLDKKGPYFFSVTCSDFLSYKMPGDRLAPHPYYDRVVMNPPFANQADIRHVNHATSFLKPGGRLVAIMSAGIDFRSNRLSTDFRSMVMRYGGVVERLPDDSFKPSGTNVNTVLVSFDVPAK